MSEGSANVAGAEDDAHGRLVAEDGVGPGRRVLPGQLLGQVQAALPVGAVVAGHGVAVLVVGGRSDGRPEGALVEGDDGLEVLRPDLGRPRRVLEGVFGQLVGDVDPSQAFDLVHVGKGLVAGGGRQPRVGPCHVGVVEHHTFQTQGELNLYDMT